ncbi:histo-blood group ABO system transferase 2-like isoform X2 [Engystomops pustulosus]|uniref:histo-blood group ABO system transferase 2-like isoform X2 n=1 Tax=Engystomops pustulosus TaxID=76066 RepID=UPI003AFA968A
MPSPSYIVGFFFLLLILGFCMQYTDRLILYRQIKPKLDENYKEQEHCKTLDDGKKKKRALNVLTPWLAPIIWNGTYNITMLDAQHKDTRIGLFVFGVKNIKYTGIKLEEKDKELEHCKTLLYDGNKNATNTLQCKDENHQTIPARNRKRALNVLAPWLAPIIWNGTYNITMLDAQHKDTRIGLFVFGVKKYIRFLLPFLESAERHFMVGHNVTYYVFTDKVNDVVKPKIAEGRILQLHHVAADQRWQDVSMRRMETLTVFTKERMPKEIDYLVCADVDMVFNDHVGVEILGDLVATIHPGYFLSDTKSFPYERRPVSAAYIPHGQGDFYYMAALYGGKVDEIYKLSMACHKGIVEDKKKDIEAIWQEESHLNRYLVYNKPTKILSPEYLWDNNLPNGEYIKRRRFIAVHKNHQEVRN